jgi:hypothetical protein
MIVGIFSRQGATAVKKCQPFKISFDNRMLRQAARQVRRKLVFTPKPDK